MTFAIGIAVPRGSATFLPLARWFHAGRGKTLEEYRMANPNQNPSQNPGQQQQGGGQEKPGQQQQGGGQQKPGQQSQQDRKSTRLNSSHRCISYAVFCLKK